jgi:hypothetical protein
MSGPAALSVSQIAMDGWRIGAIAMIKMPRHFGTAYLLIAVVDWFALPVINRLAAFAGTLIGTMVGGSFVSALLAALVSIPVYRAMLLADTRDLPIWHIRPGFWRFAGCALLTKLCFAGPLFAPGFFLGTGGGSRVAFVIVQVAALYITVRLVLAFPLSAIVAPNGVIAPAWRASRGHFWKIVGVYCVGFLPLVVLIGAFLIVTSHYLSVGTVLAGVMSRPAMLGRIAVQLFVFSLVAVMTSRLHQTMVAI